MERDNVRKLTGVAPLDFVDNIDWYSFRCLSYQKAIAINKKLKSNGYRSMIVDSVYICVYR